jgi:hypothetical protein
LVAQSKNVKKFWSTTQKFGYDFHLEDLLYLTYILGKQSGQLGKDKEEKVYLHQKKGMCKQIFL